MEEEEDEWFAGLALMNLIIREGRSWPFEEDFENVDDWRGYFLSHTAFVVRALDNGMDAAGRNSSSQGEVLGEIIFTYMEVCFEVWVRVKRD